MTQSARRTKIFNSDVFSQISRLAIVLVVLFRHSNGQDCCMHATGSCKHFCEGTSLVKLAADKILRNQTFEKMQENCVTQLSTYWDCINETFKDITRGESWSGRVCCSFSQSESCRSACIRAASSHDLIQGCRKSDEISFFSCLDRQRDGEMCCNNAQRIRCKEACLDIFKSHLTPSKKQRHIVKEECEGDNPQVNDCVREIIKVTPVNSYKHMHCCDLSNKSKCRETCKNVLSTKTTIQEILDGLEHGGCGPPLPQDYFWQCFLKPSTEAVANSAEVSRIERVGMDSAKWHCCQRAASTNCQRLCSKTFTKFWFTSWEEFRHKCLSQVVEENLRNCLDEVDEPCELGCDGLSFCTNFNNRPTELFRSCTSVSDEAARNDVTLWKNANELTLPGLKLPLKNISSCSPHLWKTVACTLQIKPCSRYGHANQICKADCMSILSKCVDWSTLDPVHTAESICSTISPEDPNTSCISLENFVNPSEQKISGQVSSPCKGNPCDSNSICVVNKNCIFGRNCSPYSCVPGCKLGEVSEYMVAHGSYVRIPIPNNPKGCLKICRCNRGTIEHCQPLPCVTLTSCLLGNQQQLHGSTFHIDCNQCNCFAGEVICSKRQCENTALSGRNYEYTTLPCNCPPIYSPVCGSNGNSYSSACLAKCAMLADANIEHFPCQDPCRTNKCPIGHKCVPNPQVCLTLMHRPCPQYICINGTTSCRDLPKEPVCDIDNREYQNSCFLAHDNAKMAYKSPCLNNCNHRGLVCGFNGRTYISECAALSDLVAIDYKGPCTAVGTISDTKSQRCYNVKCNKLPHANCLGVTPPGACCPLCGGSLRLLYSRKQIDRALYALQNQSTAYLTLKALLNALDRQILISQCVLRGYLTMELDIFVVVQSKEVQPSELQLEACVRESEKVAGLINMQSPRIVSDLSLSALTSAQIVHTLATSDANVFECNFWIVSLIFLLNFLI